MRLWLIVVLGVVCGSVAGGAMTWLELGRTVENFESVSQAKVTNTLANAISSSDLASPRAVVEGGNKFKFGTMAFGATSEQTFVIRNEGEKDLTIAFDHPSCGKCIECDFPGAVVPPGQSCNVVVVYHARKEGPAFEESAHMRTNDPRAPEMLLTLIGVITKPVRLEPGNLSFGSIPASEGATATITLLSFHTKDIAVTGHKFNNASLADLFEVSTTPMSLDKVKAKDENALAGLELRITAKTGLPLGPINENMVLAIRADKEHSIDLPINGEVVGDITIAGKGYSPENGVLSLGLIKHGEGKIATMFLLVKGPNRNEVKLSVGEVKPADSLLVKIGEGSSLGEGKAFRYPVTIEVPKSAPAQTHMGDARGELGKIVLETTHPTLKQVPVSVRFVVE